jgi:protein SCO1/2
MRCRLTILLIVLLGTALAGQPAGAHSLKDLEAQLFKREKYVEFVNRPAPEFELRDAEGKTVRLADFHAKKVVVLWFIFASCTEACPLQSDVLAQVQEKVNRSPMRDLVQFIAITTDPERDTPEVLRAYGPSHRLSPHNWAFLTSGAERPEATREIADRYGLKFTRTEKGDFMHGVVTHIIDYEGNMRARFHSLKWDQINMVVYINALTNDHH